MAVTIVPAGIPAPVMFEPTLRPAVLATVRVVEAVEAALAVEATAATRTRRPLM